MFIASPFCELIPGQRLYMTTFYYFVKMTLYEIIIGIAKSRTRLVVKLNG